MNCDCENCRESRRTPSLGAMVFVALVLTLLVITVIL